MEELNGYRIVGENAEENFVILFTIKDFAANFLWFCSKLALSHLGENIFQSENFANSTESHKSQTLNLTKYSRFMVFQDREEMTKRTVTHVISMKISGWY